MLGCKAATNSQAWSRESANENGESACSMETLRLTEKAISELPADFRWNSRDKEHEKCHQKKNGDLGVIRPGPAKSAAIQRELQLAAQQNSISWPGLAEDRAIAAEQLFGGGDIFIDRPKYFLPPGELSA